MNNSVGKILRKIGIITIICGLIGGLICWIIISDYYNGMIGFISDIIIFGSSFISGMLFIGFAEVIFLLQGCYDNSKPSSDKNEAENEDNKLNETENEYNDVNASEKLENSQNKPVEKSKIKIRSSNNIKDEDFKISVSNETIHRGILNKDDVIKYFCNSGSNTIVLGNSCYSASPVKFDAKSGNVVEILIRSTATEYKVSSIESIPLSEIIKNMLPKENQLKCGNCGNIQSNTIKRCLSCGQLIDE